MLEKLLNKNLIKELESITISDKAKYQYKHFVKNNEYESDEVLDKKLKRNWLCSKGSEKVSTKGTKTRNYGNLAIHSKDNEIISIYNICRGQFDDTVLDIDNKLKKKLNKILGLA